MSAGEGAGAGAGFCGCGGDSWGRKCGNEVDGGMGLQKEGGWSK